MIISPKNGRMEKGMKRIRKGLKKAVVLILAFVMILAVAGCASAASKKKNQEQTNVSQENAAASENNGEFLDEKVSGLADDAAAVNAAKDSKKNSQGDNSTKDDKSGNNDKKKDTQGDNSTKDDKSDNKGKNKDTKDDKSDTQDEADILEDGEYYSKEDVALYIHLYGHLPDNYITKNEAKNLGWVSSKGNLWDVAPGKVIGGDNFGNREGNLPEKKGRKYFECDVDFEGGYRGEDRLIYSNDGLVYYTGDHYSSFELLYGEE